jgi:hypothetical protein
VTDHTKVSGKTGLMMIRDLGYKIEFWFKAGYSNDYWYGMPFNWTANGTTTSVKINYPTGAAWKFVGYVNVSVSQNVTFRLTDSSGTQGMGGPTTFTVWINRVRPPDPPGTPALYNFTATSIYVWFADAWDGGAPIDARELAYGLDPYNGQHFIGVGGPLTVTGLIPNSTYYFWVRTHNWSGWSAWSGRAVGNTIKVPDPPTTPTFSNVASTSLRVHWSPNWDGGAPILAYELAYGPDPTFGATTIQASPGVTLENLIPGTTYYFWVRVQSFVGWSDWSGRGSIRTIAGARIKVGSTWKIAVPYVKVGGVWKRAEPWVRSAGSWKRTI